jgi:predicted RNA-binding Zn-ribbon protein involved in translation (DUF1610 family)
MKSYSPKLIIKLWQKSQALASTNPKVSRQIKSLLKEVRVSNPNTIKRNQLETLLKGIVREVVEGMQAMDDPNYGDEFVTEPGWISRCCQFPPIGELDKTDPKNPVGICLKCHDHATFEPAGVDEQGGGGAGGGGGGGTGAAGAGGMSVTANVSPVTVPGAFKRKKHSESLQPLGGMEEESQPITGKPYRYIYVGEGSGNVYGVSNQNSPEGAWKEFKKIVVRMAAGDASNAEFDKATVRKDNGYWSIDHPQSDEGGFFLIDIQSDNPLVQKEIKDLNLLKYADEYVAEHPLTEMTTTMSGTPGYNIPGAFAKKGGSQKGVEGSESIGYTLTPIGRDEMERRADKLLENMMRELRKGKNQPAYLKGNPICQFCHKKLYYPGQAQCHHCGKHQPEKRMVPGERSYEKRFPTRESQGLGSKFDAAQRAYDARMPEEEPSERECEKCGEEAVVTTKAGRKGNAWWWEGVCKNCGHKMSDDNF